MSRGGSGRRPPDDEGRDERRRFERPHGAEGTGPPEARFSGYHDATDHHREVTAAEIEAHEQALPESGERDFEPDVERIHRPIYREPRDPIEGREPVPWWLWAATAISLFWGGWYLGRYGGSFGTATHVAFAHLKEFVVEEAVEQGAQAALDPEVAGQRIYTARCQVCHQANGLGVPGTFPPLIGADWVVGPPEYIVLILLHGLQGPVEVRGVAYDGVMPGWGAALSDAEIAAVATYVRQWQENDAPPVEPDLVARLREATASRQQPWTAEELARAAESPDVRAAVEGAGAPDGPGASAGPDTSGVRP